MNYKDIYDGKNVQKLLYEHELFDLSKIAIVIY